MLIIAQKLLEDFAMRFLHYSCRPLSITSCDHPLGWVMLFTWILFSLSKFQIYHSPIHKQAESKSLVIPPSILSLLFLNVTSLSIFFSSSAVELNEVGFKFVQKCINCIETKGKRGNQDFILGLWDLAWGGHHWVIFLCMLTPHMQTPPGGKKNPLVVSQVVLSDANYQISATLWGSFSQIILDEISIFHFTNP